MALKEGLEKKSQGETTGHEAVKKSNSTWNEGGSKLIIFKHLFWMSTCIFGRTNQNTMYV